MDRVTKQLGLRGKLHGTKNEFWVNLQKEPKTGQWLWNNMTEQVLKYTNSNFGQWSALKGKVSTIKVLPVVVRRDLIQNRPQVAREDSSKE